jgi:hypothetical protein
VKIENIICTNMLKLILVVLYAYIKDTSPVETFEKYQAGNGIEGGT